MITPCYIWACGKEVTKVKEEMQKAKQSLDQPKVQMLSKEAKGQCVYTEKEEEIGCLGRGITAG